MNAQSGRSFLSPVLIGRASQVEYLRWLLSDESRPGTVIVSGEAGIGKSRLAREARVLAEDAGYEVIQGSCFERDRALPHSLMIDVLRHSLLNRAPNEVETLLGDSGREVVKLVPELALQCPSIVPTMALDAEQEKRRLFHALSQLLGRLSRDRGLLVVLEDLHWADETTLEFLLHCCRSLSGDPARRAVLLLTYRPEDAQPPLVHALAELDRLRLATEIGLEQLTRAETEVMVRAILDLHRPLRRDYSQALFELTEGNPFFIEEVLKSLHTSTGDAPDVDGQAIDLVAVPRTVEDAVTRRCEQLGAGSRDLLEIAAVAGQRFDLPLMQKVTGSSGQALLDQVKELVAAQLVTEEAPQRFRFRHALTREAVYAHMLSTERRDRHRALAEAIEDIIATQPEELEARLGDLAHHFFEAGIWSRAQQYCEEAGRRARDLFAPAACVQHLSHALEAARRLGEPQTPSILRLRAGSYELMGEFNKALADLETALESAQRQKDEREEWEALTALGMLWLSRDYGRAGDHFEAALSLARRMDDRRLVAHTLNRVGNWQMNVGDPPAALARHQEALSVFRELGDLEGMAETLDLLGMTSFHSVRLADQAAYHSQAVALFRELGNRQGAISSLSLLAMNATNYDWAMQASGEAEFGEAVAAGEAALWESGEIGWRAGEAFACYALGMALGARGRYDRALPIVKQGLAIAEEIEHSQWQVANLRALGELEVDLLAPERARTTLERGLALAQETKSGFWTACLSAALSRALTQLREPEAAAQHLDPFDAASRPGLITWLSGCAHADMALASRDFGLVLQVVDILEGWAWPDGRPSRLTLVRAEALLGLERPEQARAALDALLTPDARDIPAPLRWRGYALLGRILSAEGRRAEALSAYAAAQACIAEVAETVGDDTLRQLFASRASAQLPRSRPAASARRLAKQRFEGLTEREREVAALIAEGRSNRQIAEALVLSERTLLGNSGPNI
jgi:tetratricopeptide (TPR) repeat protein